jgi:hypothetical protein
MSRQQPDNPNQQELKPQRQRSYGHLRILSWMLEFAAFACVIAAVLIFVVNSITSLQQPELLLALGLIVGAVLLHMAADGFALLVRVYERQLKLEYLLRLEIQRQKQEWQHFAQQQSKADRLWTQSMLDENDYVLYQLEERKKSLGKNPEPRR